MMLMAPWFALVVVVIIAIVWASQWREDDRDGVALQVLDRRLAEGDLTVEEHAERRQVLQERGRGSRSRSRWWGGPVTVIAAATLGVILFAWSGMPGWGASGWMGGHMRGGATSSTTDVVDGAQEVQVEAGELWFDPSTVEMTAGEPVNLRLVNTGDAFHDVTVPAADVVLAAEPGEQAVGAIEFTEPGRYEFSCSVPGHAQGGMRGTIVVTESD